MIKQINLLEKALEVVLFERTHCWLVLAKAGESLYQDAKYIIRYCKDSVICAQNAMNEGENIIRIGSSPMTPAQLLMHRGWSNYVDRLRDDIWLAPRLGAERNREKIFKGGANCCQNQIVGYNL